MRWWPGHAVPLGEHAPCDRYPSWELMCPQQDLAFDWEQHRRPNAFGRCIASDPCKSEFTSEIGVTRGGDGASATCSDAGFFIGWLTLATAYFEDGTCRHGASKPFTPGYSIGRRVLELR
jgi:hypothetical protein